MKADELLRTLSAVNKVARVITMADGSRLLILEHGGRILGLFTPESDENFFWTNPVLASIESAKRFYDSDEWHNSGGERMWLSPEIDLFFPDYPDLALYHQPRQLDPGNYELSTENGCPCLTNRLALTPARSGKRVELEISKSIAPAVDPLRYEPGFSSIDSVYYAGYTLQASLKITGGDTGCRIGLWNLLQLPHGGDLVIPTHSKAVPRVYFGDIPPDDLEISDHLLIYHMRAGGEQKIGIRVVPVTGRVGYLYRTGNRWALVVRSFTANPSGEYIDSPWDFPDEIGYAVQACNICSGLGEFSELEYHAPAIGGETGYTCCRDESLLWAYRGDKETILEIAEKLLSSDLRRQLISK